MLLPSFNVIVVSLRAMTMLTFDTVTVLVAVNPPSDVVTVIEAVPGATPVTTPLLSTEAIDVSSEDHVTFWLVALLGVIDAVRVCVKPTVRLNDGGLTVTPVTAVPVTFTVDVRLTVTGI